MLSAQQTMSYREATVFRDVVSTFFQSRAFRVLDPQLVGRVFGESP